MAEINQIQVDGTSYNIEDFGNDAIIVEGATPTIVAEANRRYVCGTVTALNFTPSGTGICDVVFSCGSTPAELTVPNTVMFPDWFDPTDLQEYTTYELNILDGIFGAVGVWG